MTHIFYINKDIFKLGYELLDYNIFKELNYDVTPIELEATPRKIVTSIPKLLKMAINNRHKSGNVFYSWHAYNCQGPLIGKILNIPSIIIAGGNDVSDDHYAKLGPSHMNIFSKTLVKSGLNLSTQIITDSEFATEELQKLITEWKLSKNIMEKTEMIYPAVDLREFRKNTNHEIHEKFSYFMTVGLLSKNNAVRKGYNTLLEATIENKKWMIKNNMKIIFFGDEVDDYLKNKIKNHNLGKLIKIIHFNRSVLKTYLSDAIAYIQPSTHEMFGVAMVEAMACRCPIIASNVTALPEVAADAALYVKPTSPKQLASRMIEIYNNKNLRKTLGLNGENRVDKYFSKEERKKKLKKVIDNLVK